MLVICRNCEGHGCGECGGMGEVLEQWDCAYCGDNGCTRCDYRHVQDEIAERWANHDGEDYWE